MPVLQSCRPSSLRAEMSRRPNYRVDQFGLPFLVLEENRFAYASITALLELSSKQYGRQVLIYGPTGCGKSHLADLLSRELRRISKPEIIHLSAADLLIDDAESLDAKLSMETPNRPNGTHKVVICGDIQAVSNQSAAQANLTRIIDDCRKFGVDLLMTSNRSPGDISGLTSRLRNRLQGGVCAGLRKPGPTARQSLIEHYCSHLQIAILPEAIRLLAKHLPVSPRELFGAIQRFDQLAKQHRQVLDASFAKVFMTHEISPKAITIDDIAKAVSKEFGLKLVDVRSDLRDQQLKTARQCAMFLAREIAGERLTVIGEYFGNRSHSTVLHSCHRIKESLGEDAKLRQRLEIIKQSLGSGL